MKAEREKQANTFKLKLLTWFKQPANIFLILILLAVTVVGIVDDNLEIIMIVYAVAFLYGILFGLFFYIKDKYFK